MNKLSTPRKAPVPLEHDEQAQWFAWLRANHPKIEALTYAIPNQGVSGSKGRTVRYGAKRKREGLKKGVPDVFIAWPTKTHHGMYIEFKRQKFKPSQVKPEQHEWIERLTAKGYAAVVCGGCDSAKTAVKMYLEGER